MSVLEIPLQADELDNEHCVLRESVEIEDTSFELIEFWQAFGSLTCYQALRDSGPRWWQPESPLRQVLGGPEELCDLIGSDADTVTHMRRQTALTALVLDSQIQYDPRSEWVQLLDNGVTTKGFMLLESLFHDLGECHEDVGDVSDKQGKDKQAEQTERAHHYQLLHGIFTATDINLAESRVVSDINVTTFENGSKLNTARREIEILGYLMTGIRLQRILNTDDGSFYNFNCEEKALIRPLADDIVRRNLHRLESARHKFAAIDDYLLRVQADEFCGSVAERLKGGDE